MAPRGQAHVTIVVPVYNGALTIGRLVTQLTETYREAWALEIVLVNDGSRDNSRDVCDGLAAEFPGIVRFVHLARNIGEHRAVITGLRHATGDIVAIMDDDFQNPPEEVRKLVETLRHGDYDVVYSRYQRKAYPRWRRLGSWFNDRVANVMLRKPRDLYLSSFKCMTRLVVKQVRSYDGPFPYLDGLILRVTRNVGVATCEHQWRAAGRSGYSLRKLVSLWFDMFALGLVEEHLPPLSAGHRTPQKPELAEP